MHWCILSLVAVTVVAIIIRWLARKITSNNNFIIHTDEFVGNLCAAVFMMELGVIASMYGEYSFVLALGSFIHLYLKIMYFSSNKPFANPLAFVELYYENGRQRTFSFFFAVSIILTQLAGLYSGQEFAKVIWAFEDHTHVEVMQIPCKTSLSIEYTLVYAAFLEGVGVMIGGCMDFVTPYKLQPAEGAFVVTTLFFLFGHVNGMYMNPSLATAFSFRCEGHQSDWEHLVVYWLVPCIGMILARELCWFGKKIMHKETAKKVE